MNVALETPSHLWRRKELDWEWQGRRKSFKVIMRGKGGRRWQDWSRWRRRSFGEMRGGKMGRKKMAAYRLRFWSWTFLFRCEVGIAGVHTKSILTKSLWYFGKLNQSSNISLKCNLKKKQYRGKNLKLRGFMFSCFCLLLSVMVLQTYNLVCMR